MSALCEIEAIERMSFDILGLFGPQREEVMATAHFEPFNPALPWIHLACRYGGIIGLAWGEPLPGKARLARTISVGRRLRRSGLSGSYLLTEGFGTLFPVAQRIVESTTSHGVEQIRFATPYDIYSPPSDGFGPISARILDSPLPIRVELFGVTGALEPGSRIFFDSLVVAGSSRRFRSRCWLIEEERFVMTVEEKMEAENGERAPLLATEVGVAVDVGVFQMTLGDLLSLRPGVRLELPFAAPLRGILKVEGATVGLATLAWSGNSLMATLEEVDVFAEVKKNRAQTGNDERQGTITTVALPGGGGESCDSMDFSGEEI